MDVNASESCPMATILNPHRSHLGFISLMLNATCYPDKSGARTFLHNLVTCGYSGSFAFRMPSGRVVATAVLAVVSARDASTRLSLAAVALKWKPPWHYGAHLFVAFSTQRMTQIRSS